MFNRYYLDELAFLREMGKEFASANQSSSLGRYLAGQGSDPDVERLLEGFAFLTGRIREKLDDEFPQLTQTLLNCLWPHYLRPIPAASILQFFPRNDLGRQKLIEKGSEIKSRLVDGSSARFRTCFDVEVQPLVIEAVRVTQPTDGKYQCAIRFAFLPAAQGSSIPAGPLRIYLSGNAASSLYLWLCLYTEKTTTRQISPAGAALETRVGNPEAAGFVREEALIPYSATSFDGYRILQEYLAFPEKFLFIRFPYLPILGEISPGAKFEIVCTFAKEPPREWNLTAENLRLFCTPVVNLFKADSAKVRITQERLEYLIRPDESTDEVYSVDEVESVIQGTGKTRTYVPLDSFDRRIDDGKGDTGYYRTELRRSLASGDVATWASFISPRESDVIPSKETATVRLTCFNPHLTKRLGIDDINCDTDSSPDFATFTNISRVSASVPAPDPSKLHWQLISHLVLNSASLADVNTFRGVLSLYNLHFAADANTAKANAKRLKAINSVESRAEDFFIDQVVDPQKRRTRRYGAVIRGTAINISLDIRGFADAGDLYMFGNVLNEFCALYATVNSATQLTVTESTRGEVYTWQPRIGQQIAF